MELTTMQTHFAEMDEISNYYKATSAQEELKKCKSKGSVNTRKTTFMFFRRKPPMRLKSSVKRTLDLPSLK
jgi:hypothetical protein